MRHLPLILVLGCMAALAACNSASHEPEEKKIPFCDTDCKVDTIKAAANDKEKSVVRITLTKCAADSITWGNQAMTSFRQLPFEDMVGRKGLKLHEGYYRVDFFDSKYAWVQINECDNGQGYIFKLPFNKADNIFRKNSAFNPMDPAYRVDTTLVAYTDRGNIFIEEKSTGRKATMTFGVQTDMDYQAMHETVDSVNISPTRIWAHVRIGKEWKPIEKAVTLQ